MGREADRCRGAEEGVRPRARGAGPSMTGRLRDHLCTETRRGQIGRIAPPRNRRTAGEGDHA